MFFFLLQNNQLQGGNSIPSSTDLPKTAHSVMIYSLLHIFAVTQTALELLHSLSACYYSKDLQELYPFVTRGALRHQSFT